MIKVYISSIREGSETDWEKLKDSLPWEARKERIKRLRFEDDKRRSILAGALLYHVLKQAGVDIPSIKNIQRGPDGKPYLPDLSGIHFNLSHSGDLAVCAIGEKNVGIDVESKRSSSSLKIAKRFFTQEEYDHISQSVNPDDEFVKIWTLKESYIKMTGEGLRRPLNDFGVIPPSPELSGLFMREFSYDTYHISVCAEEEIDDRMQVLALQKFI